MMLNLRNTAAASLLSLAVTGAAWATTVANTYTLSAPAGNLSASNAPYTNLTVVNGVSLAASGWSGQATNASGMAVLYANDGTTINQEALLFNPANTAAGLVPVGPASIVNSQGKLQQTIVGITTSGAIAGNAVDAYGTSNGNSNGNGNAWVYPAGATSPTVLANTGGLLANPSIYSYQSGTLYEQFAKAVAGTGWTIGTAKRYGGNGTNTSFGQDGWIYNPNNPSAGAVIIPLINNSSIYQSTQWTGDSSYTNHINESVSPLAVNASGTAIGSMGRFYNSTHTDNVQPTYGSDGWMYKNGTTTEVGLIGSLTSSPYTFSYDNGGPLSQYTQLAAVNDAGQIAGQSSIYQSGGGIIGAITWIYTPSATPGTASGLYFSSAANNSFTATGAVSGSYGTYRRVGLLDALHQNSSAQGLDTSSVGVLKASGQAAGYSNRYSSGFYIGQDVWYFSGVAGTASLLVAPTANPAFNYDYISATNNRFSSITQMNTAGLIAGYSNRVYKGDTASLGQDAWVYDPTAGSAGTTFVLNPYASSSGNYSTSKVQFLSDTGIALGIYSTYSGVDSSTLTGTYVFAWHENGTGPGTFVTLGSALTNTLSSAGWASLAGMISVGSDGTLYGLGTTTASNQSLSGIFGLTPVLDGDVDLNGAISIDGYLAIDRGFKLGLTGWANGDFNHDGTINALDYALIDAAYRAQHGTLAEGEIALHTAEFGQTYLNALSAVPEPASCSLIALGVCGMTMRRRRRG